jgi:hypothetical protein
MPQDADWRCYFHQNRKQPCLIREYYGSLAIRVAQLKGGRTEATASRTLLPDGIGSLNELESVIAEVARQEDERAKATVRELLDEQLPVTCDDTTAGLTVETVQPGRFTGQVVRDGERIVYASLPVTKKWLADNKWQTAKRLRSER